MLMSMRSASISVSIGERPLNGTCSMSMAALVLNSSPARWAPEPLPVEPNVRLPGFALATATTSPTLVTARLLRTTSTWGIAAMPATGVKSFTASYGQFLIRLWLVACVWLVPSTRVWPSGSARATALAPMMPDPPGRLSTTID